MDDETRAYLDAMRSEVMTRMNDNQEKLLERHRATAAALMGLATSVTVLTTVAHSTNTELASVNALLTVIAGSQGDLGRWAAARRG